MCDVIIALHFSNSFAVSVYCDRHTYQVLFYTVHNSNNCMCDDYTLLRGVFRGGRTGARPLNSEITDNGMKV